MLQLVPLAGLRDSHGPPGPFGPWQAGMGIGHLGDLGQNIVRHWRRVRPVHVDMQQQRFRRCRKPTVDMADFLKQMQPLGVEIEHLRARGHLRVGLEFAQIAYMRLGREKAHVSHRQITGAAAHQFERTWSTALSNSTL
jgi:hypothetical protein